MDILEKKDICLLHKIQKTTIWHLVSYTTQEKGCIGPESQFI